MAEEEEERGDVGREEQGGAEPSRLLLGKSCEWDIPYGADGQATPECKSFISRTSHACSH